MRDWEKERSDEISEIVLVAHIICILIFLMVIASFYNFRIGANFYWPFALLLLAFSAIGALYLARKVLSKIFFMGQSKTDELILLMVIFPLTIAFLWYTGNFVGAKVLVTIPVMIAATAFGSRVGICASVLVAVILFFMDFYIFHKLPSDVFQTNVIVVGVTTLLAWLVGSLITVERRIQEELAQLADYDQLTGLSNHRYFQEKLVISLKEAAKKAEPLSIVLFDIDQFRYYNTTYGYQKGDQILEAIGPLLQNPTYPGVYSARYGSNQFMLALSGKDRSEAVGLVEEIREKMTAAATGCLVQEQNEPAYKPFTMSMGIATYSRDATEALSLCRAAEDDLFRAKYTKGMAYLYRSVLSELNTLRIQEAFPSLQAFVALINSKDRYTFGHSERVEAFSLALADKLKMSEEEKTLLRYGAYLHDIGKIEIEMDVLNKKGALEPHEWDIMKSHTILGSEIVKPLVAFRDIVPIVRSHHENLDGSGYPDGLKGDQIPFLAQIVRVTDSFDAMISDRPYRKGLSVAEACAELRRGSGTQYNPVLVDRFVEAVEDHSINLS